MTGVGSVLVGIVPADEQLCDLIQNNIRSIGDNAIEWVDCRSPLIVPDTGDDHRTLTLLLQAWTEVPPDRLVDTVQMLLKESSSRKDDGKYPLCELWASAPAPLPMRPAVETPWETEGTRDAEETMREWGLYVHSNLLGSEESMSTLRENVDREIRNAEEQLAQHRPELRVGQDNFRFREIASRSSQRFDLLITENEFVQSFVTSHVLEQEAVAALLDRLLGSEFTFDVSVVYSKPGASHQGWHADGNHEKGSQDAGWELDGWRDRLAAPYAVCLFLPLIDLDDSVGFTQFWPGSHRNRDLFGFGKVAELLGTWDGKCAAGAGIFYDYRLWHRGMPNQSSTVRPVLQILFRRTWYVERANYGVEPIEHGQKS